MTGHEQFEELCALAALEQATPEDLVSLREHLAQCEACRLAYADFSELIRCDLPAAHQESGGWWSRLRGLFENAGYKKRFLVYAQSQGLRFSEQASAGSPSLARIARFKYAAAVAVGALVASLGLTAIRPGAVPIPPARDASLERRISELDRDRNELQRKIAEQEQAIAALRLRLVEQQNAGSRALLRAAGAEQQRSEYAKRLEELESSLEAELAKSSGLNARLAVEQQRLAEAQAEARRAPELNAEVERLKGVNANDEVTAALQQRQVDDLSRELQAQRDLLGRERQLLAAGRDIRDLMGARNLHIMDVLDADPRGRNRQTFGRVFYTEGKSLIFYAFDLDKAKAVPAKCSFQAWGVSEGNSESARSLGILYVDDAKQKRWILKVEDPKLLSQIESVFVTVEPFGGAKRPSGQKLLYAYVKNPANHP